MPSNFQKANTRNRLELRRLTQLIENLKFINAHKKGSGSINWLNNNGRRLSETNIERIKRVNIARKANPEKFNVKKLSNKNNIEMRRTARIWMYGYYPKEGKNWVKKGNLKLSVPPHLPVSEVKAFHGVRMHGILQSDQGTSFVLPPSVEMGPYRDILTAEGTLKPVVYRARRKPSPGKPPAQHLPTLKELAWKATPMSTMTNEQLKFMSQMTPMNLMMLKPKKRAARLPVNNVTSYRRHAAARTIQNAAKKYLGRKASQSGRGPTPRSPATLAREANIGVMGGARRSSGPTNNTRVTWARRANGTINRFKTLTNLNLTLTKAQRNTLSEMSENKAMNTIRQLSRKK